MLTGLQDRLLRLLGTPIERRAAIVRTMLQRDPTEATSYWLQLSVAVGIATLGLVVGSTAVVIGAMLIAPLMGPIIGLAMGLATGSPYLVLRSSGRVGMSVVFAVGAAAAITRLLPFHELNPEIVARTSPTALDLVIASFCAIAGAYAALRPATDTASTAAGTSIGISLVPPLCASGFGIGTLGWSVAGGAALLFLTNAVAIVFVGTVTFVAAGFNRVDVVALERDVLEGSERDAPMAGAVARRLNRLFASRGGPALRFLMPFVLLGAIFIPLRKALDEVAWEVRARAAVRDVLANEPRRVLQPRLRIEHHEIELVVVILGGPTDAEVARARIETAITATTGVRPRLEVVAVPDAEAFDAATRLTAPLPTLTPHEPVAGMPQLRALLNQVWPSDSVGPALDVELGLAGDASLRVRVVHIGRPLGADGREAIERALSAELGAIVTLDDVGVSDAPLNRDDGDLAFVSHVAAASEATARIAAITVCIARPTDGDAGTDEERALRRALDAALSAHSRIELRESDTWSVRFVAGSCPGASDAGTETD